MTSVTFENATLAELIKRIERVTPKKGEAFDKASGIVFEISPGDDWPVVAKATNLEIYYTEWVNTLEVSGDPVRWRLPSIQLAAVVTKLPIGSGKTVTLTAEGGKMSISSGRFKAKIGMISPEYYPNWKPFDPSVTSPVADLGARIQQVSWATERGAVGTLAGVRFNGETVVATDKYRAAASPLKIDGLQGDLVVPLGPIAPLLRQMGDTNIGILPNGMLALMPNEFTQITATIYEDRYPPVEKIMARDHSHSVKLHRDLVNEIITRVTAANLKDRMPEMQVFVGNEEVAFFVKESDGESFAGDVYEIPGQAKHERFMFRISPSSFTDALGAAPNPTVELFYSIGEPKKILRLDGGSGFECWLAPRSGMEAKDER